MPNANLYLNSEAIKKIPQKESIKCKQLLEIVKNLGTLSNSTNTSTSTFERFENLNINEGKLPLIKQPTNDDVINQLKLYIDERFKEVEEEFKMRLDIMEERQMRKLDDILSRLEQFK